MIEQHFLDDCRRPAPLPDQLSPDSVLVRHPLECRIRFLVASLGFAIRCKSTAQAENVTLRRKLALVERELERAEEDRAVLLTTLVHNIAGDGAGDHDAAASIAVFAEGEEGLLPSSSEEASREARRRVGKEAPDVRR